MTNDAARIADGKAPSKALRIGFWFVQALLSLTFTGTGLWKLLTPVSKARRDDPVGRTSPRSFQATAVVFVFWGRRFRAPISPRVT